MIEQRKKLRKEEFINKYLGFKNSCTDKQMIDIEEIIKLFGVYLKLF